MIPQLQHDLGTIAWFMSSYTHPRNPIREKYMNRPKEHKLEGLILVGWATRILCRKGKETTLYYFFVATSPVLSYSPHVVMHVWYRRIVRRVSLVIHKLWISRSLSCNQLVAWSQKIESSGGMKKKLSFHQENTNLMAYNMDILC